MSYWTVVQAQPMCERRALWHLDFQGFKTYAPREKITRVKRGRKVAAARWLFPRYIFVWVVDQWHELFSTIGISKVLMTGERPAHLPERWITDMKSKERNGLITLPKHRFDIGQRVVVFSGPFAGQRGMYYGQGSRQREIVLLEALGRVELAPGLLR